MIEVLDPPAGERAAVLASGGLDSTVLLWWLHHHSVAVAPIFVNYGHAAAEQELLTLRSVTPSGMEVIEVPVDGVYGDLDSPSLRARDLWSETVTDESLHLPGRNLFLLACGILTAERIGSAWLCAAFITSNVTPTGDRSLAFLEAVQTVGGTSSGVVIDYPFLHLSKAQVVRLGLELGAPIGKTFSCQVAARTPCGACANCVDRLHALEAVRGDWS